MEKETTCSQDIQSGDALIHCEIAGPKDAPVLVLLHGNGEDLHIFDPQINYLSKFCRIIAVDTRGHGQSTRGTAPLTFHTFASDLLTVLDALQVDNAHIIGFSDGAITALHIALTAPEHIRSMILLGVNYNPKGIRLIPRLQIRLAYIGLSVASFFSPKVRKRKEIWGLMVFQPNLTKEEIARITVPALVVTGENDMASQRQNDEIHRLITGSKRLVIPGGNHFWMFKKPELLNNCIIDFTSKIWEQS